MADKEEASSGGDNATRGTDWEVVSLTASAYAASPGPKPVDDDVTPPPYEAETTTTTSHPLYMSRHFAFPPSEEEQHHTDIPTEPSEKKMKMDSEFSVEQETGKEDGGDLTLKGLDLAKDDEFDFLQEGKGKSNIYMQDERAFGGEHSDPIQQQTDVAPPELEEEHHQVAAAANSPPPCEPWWKRSAASLISQAKETNTVWSIFIAAAAVMGVVVLGQRWQHDRWQVLQLNWESTIGNEKAAGRLMGPISRLKQAFVGGQRRDSFIRAAGSQNDS
ncbi:ATG8-interacting protein 2 [Brassica rapa]|uniref:ATG8-interacting protein 1 n=1 Tax=Brassica campestris TaxID=3711 RepID=M4C9U8_BRACM|nr:ATG8-interacting protein 2 [Brassica rapa]XP_009134565.1 ATG8-interacting protein 2 [Brassica rapa]XP_033142134.1 ATG8-interacting protein 2 [Brassica rapa]XP_033142135.1 ATG8-interacting protein 2 [Brassica rapa]